MWLLRLLPPLLTLASSAAENDKWKSPEAAERRQGDWVPLTGPCINCQHHLLGTHVDNIPPPLSQSLRNEHLNGRPVHHTGNHQIQPQPFLQLPRIYTQNQFLSQSIPPHLINGQFLQSAPLPEHLFAQDERHDTRANGANRGSHADPHLSIALDSDIRNAHRIIASLDSTGNGRDQTARPNDPREEFNSSVADEGGTAKEEVQILYVPVETLNNRMRNSGLINTDRGNFAGNREAPHNPTHHSRQPTPKDTNFRHPIQPLKEQFRVGQVSTFEPRETLPDLSNYKIIEPQYTPSADAQQIPKNIEHHTYKNDNVQENSQKTYRAKEAGNERSVNLASDGLNSKPESRLNDHRYETVQQGTHNYSSQNYFQQPAFNYANVPQPTLPPPNQPPLSVYLETTEKIADVLDLLKHSNTIPVLDSIGPNSPHVFVGPSNLNPPNGYLKFELPYLSSLHADQLSGRIEELPFFVAPLNFNPPPGYSKIPFPAPHIGSVLVSNSTSLRAFQHQITDPNFTPPSTPAIVEPYSIPLGISPLNPQLPSLINSLQVEKETLTTVLPSTTTTAATETYVSHDYKNSRRNHFRGSHRHTSAITTTTRRPQPRQRRPYTNRSYAQRNNAYPETSTSTTQQPTEHYNIASGLQSVSGISTGLQNSAQSNKQNETSFLQNPETKFLNIDNVHAEYKTSGYKNNYNPDIVQYNRNEEYQLVPQIENKYVSKINIDSGIQYEQPNHPVNLKDIIIELETTTEMDSEVKSQPALKDYRDRRIPRPSLQSREPVLKQIYQNLDRQNLFDNSGLEESQAIGKDINGQQRFQDNRLVQPNTDYIPRDPSVIQEISQINLFEKGSNNTSYDHGQNSRKYLPEAKSLDETVTGQKAFNQQISIEIPEQVSIDNEMNQSHVNGLQTSQRQFNQRQQRPEPSSVQSSDPNPKVLLQTTEYENHPQRIKSDYPLEPPQQPVTEFYSLISPTVRDNSENINENLRAQNHRLRSRTRARNQYGRERNQVPHQLVQSIYTSTELPLNTREYYTTEIIAEKSTTDGTAVRTRGRVRGRNRAQFRPRLAISEPPNYPTTLPSVNQYKANTEQPNYRYENRVSFQPSQNPVVGEVDNQKNKYIQESTTNIYSDVDDIKTTTVGSDDVGDPPSKKVQNRVRGHRRPLRLTSTTSTTTTSTPPPATKYLIRTRRPSHPQTKIQKGRGRIRRPTTSTTTETPTTHYSSQQKPNNFINFAQISNLPAYKISTNENNRFDSSNRNNFPVNYVSRLPPQAHQPITPSAIDDQSKISYDTYTAHTKTSPSPNENSHKNVFDNDNYKDYQNVRLEEPLNLNYNNYDGSKQDRAQFQNGNEPIGKNNQQKVTADYWNDGVSIEQSKSYVFRPETSVLTTQQTPTYLKTESKVGTTPGMVDQQSYGDYDDYFSYLESSQYSTLDQSSIPSDGQFKPLTNQSQDAEKGNKIHQGTSILIPNIAPGSKPASSQLPNERNYDSKLNRAVQPLIYLGHPKIHKGEIHNLNLTNFISTSSEPATILNQALLGLTESSQTVSNKQTETDLTGKKDLKRGTWIKVRVKKPKDFLEAAESQSFGSVSSNSLQPDKLQTSKENLLESRIKQNKTTTNEEIKKNINSVNEYVDSLPIVDWNVDNFQGFLDSETIIQPNTESFTENYGSTISDFTTENAITEFTTLPSDGEPTDQTVETGVLQTTTSYEEESFQILGISNTTEISVEVEMCYRGRCVKTMGNKKSDLSDLMSVE